MLTYKESYQIVERHLKALSFEKSPSGLYRPISYVLSIGGKRVRPVLSVMSHSLYNDDIKVVVNAALGIELFHNFTLLHDDIMDNAPLRRNSPTVHMKWSSNTAILSGDAMMILAYQLISKTEKKLIQKVLDLFNKTALEVCEGQQLDMDYEKQNGIGVTDYLRMIRLKTAVLIAASMAIGGITAGACEGDVECLYQAGINMGLAFQLQDDFLDVFAQNSEFGKSTGGDIVANKKTFLLINALASDDTRRKSILTEWLMKEQFDPYEKIAVFKKTFEELNIREITKSQITLFHQEAIRHIQKIKLPEIKKSGLYEFFESIMSRTY